MTKPKPRRSAGQVAHDMFYHAWIGQIGTWETCAPAIKTAWRAVARAVIRHHIQASKKRKSR